MADTRRERFRRLFERIRRPHRLTNWLAARRERETRPDRMISLPLGLDIEPTTRCNLRCRLCQRKEAHWPETDLTFERFRRILDQVPALEQIKLQGIGEPLLNEKFFDMVRLARDRRIRVFSITNGTTLKDRGLQFTILTCGLTELLVSIDGATAETQAKWRGGADLEEIVHNLGNLISRRRWSRLPRIGIWTVGNPDNLQELPGLVDLASAAGADFLTYQTDITAWGKDDWLVRQADSRIDPETEEAAARFAEARAQAERRHLEFNLYTGNRFDADHPCFWPWESAFVSAEGYVTRCCIASDPRLHNFGRIDDTPFREIWNSEGYREFRRAIRENDIPAICRPCYRMEREEG